MPVTLTSSVPVYAGPPNIVTTIIAPNQGVGFLVTIGDVAGLQATLDTKLEDVAGAIAPLAANVITTGAELNFLSGVTSNVQTQLDGKVDIAGDTMIGSLLMDPLTQILIDPASELLPGLAFNGDIDTGIWSPAGDTIAFAVAGGDVFRILPTGVLHTEVVDYETLVLDDDDIPNKKYVDDEILAAVGGPFLPLAGGVMTGDIDLDGNSLILDVDADTFFEASVDDAVNLWIGGMPEFVFNTTTLSVGTKTITNVADPITPQDAATMNYVDTEIIALALNGTGPYLRLSGADTMLGALDMGTNLINNVVDPVAAQDAATMNYVDTEIVALGLGGVTGPFLRLSGADTMLGALDMGGFGINNVLDPVLAQDAVTLAYADATYLTTTGATGPLGGNLDAGTFRIINLGDPINPQDAATKNYVDSNFLDLLGTSIMLGDLDMGGFGINNVLDPVLAQDAATKNYVDSNFLDLLGTSTMLGDINMGGFLISNLANATANDEAVNLGQTNSLYLRLDGTSAMLGALNMGGFGINAVLDPVLAQDAATKNYVDTEIAALSLDATFVNVTGDTMTGDLTMGGGAQHLADNGLLATPGYAFASAPDTGMLWDGTNLRFSVATMSGLTIAPTGGANEIDVHGRRVTGVADPTEPDDATTRGWIEGLATTKLLGSVSGIDLTVPGTTPIYILPAAVMHIITQIIVRATAYTPGVTPTNSEISIGISNPWNQIIPNDTELDWGGISGAADQVVYLQPRDGSPSPNSGETITFEVDTAAGGTFSALVATVYVLGIEL